MIRLIILLAVIALMVVIGVMVWQWWKARVDLQKLREEPPKRIGLLVRLPKESEKSNIKMTRFFSRMERLMAHDPKSVASNQNVISAALIGSGGGQGQAPTIKFIIWSPPELAERVMLELQECYEGQAQVTELKPGEDPLGEWLDGYQSMQQIAQQAKDQEES